jgi:opacity protein-like surface antigen
MTKLVAILALAFSGSAWAQTGELWFLAGQSVLSSPGLGTTQAFGGSSKDVQLTDGFSWGLRFGFNQGTHFGYELGYGYNRTHLQFNTSGAATSQGMAYHQGTANFLYYLTKEGNRIRPFATGGVHFSRFVPPGTSVSQGGGDTKYGVNYGFGVKVRVHSFWAVRADFRQYETGKPFNLPMASGRLFQNEISGGIGVGF